MPASASTETPTASFIPVPGSIARLLGSGRGSGAAGAGPALAGLGVGAPSGAGGGALASPLAAATPLIGPGTATASRSTPSPPPGHGTSPPASPATVIERFISTVPTGVWIALAAALAMTALASGVAVASGRRARRRLGEVAAVTTVAVTDALTGVLNRGGFTAAVEQELERARRYAHPLALAFVDVRGLKAVNDGHGHLAGDRLLQAVARLLSDSARTYDVVGRIGGDELAILLPEQEMVGVAALADRIRSHVAECRAALGVGNWDLTIGTSVFPEDGEDFEQLLATADRRLYEQRGIYIR